MPSKRCGAGSPSVVARWIIVIIIVKTDRSIWLAVLARRSIHERMNPTVNLVINGSSPALE